MRRLANVADVVVEERYLALKVVDPAVNPVSEMWLHKPRY